MVHAEISTLLTDHISFSSFCRSRKYSVVLLYCLSLVCNVWILTYNTIVQCYDLIFFSPIGYRMTEIIITFFLITNYWYFLPTHTWSLFNFERILHFAFSFSHWTPLKTTQPDHYLLNSTKLKLIECTLPLIGSFIHSVYRQALYIIVNKIWNIDAPCQRLNYSDIKW